MTPTSTPTSWATGRPIRSPFDLPCGLRGRLAARIMVMINRQRDLVPLLDLQPGERVLEVGYGPGILMRLLAQTPGVRAYGVDPSPEMRAVAGRGIDAELRLGTAADTGFPDAYFNRVVSVNNVAIWPDLAAGLRELRRVTRPDGRLLIAWHGGTSPSGIVKRFALPEDRLDQLRVGLLELFADVTRHELSSLTVFAARS
jgi:SAM-dependent methyltransferase